MHRYALYAGLVLAAVVLIAWVGIKFLSACFEVPPAITICSPVLGNASYSPDQSAEFQACLKENAETFIKYDYAEAKDASKAFLTLMVAVFVASVTFSEKIVGIGAAGWVPRSLMILCWILILFAIVSCGAAFAFMTVALSGAAHAPARDYWTFENYAGWLFIIAGISFSCGLAAMLVTGIIAIVRAKSSGT